MITIWNVALRRDFGKYRVQEGVFRKGDEDNTYNYSLRSNFESSGFLTGYFSRIPSTLSCLDYDLGEDRPNNPTSSQHIFSETSWERNFFIINF